MTFLHYFHRSSQEDELQEVHQLQSSYRAFAALLLDGSVCAWGDPAFGGDCQQVREQLVDVCARLGRKENMHLHRAESS